MSDEQLQFLLRSLDDLDAERAAGGIDDETYARLHADYTARAAAAVRVADGEGSSLPEPDGPSTGRRVLTVVGLVGFAVVAAVALAYGLGARLPGQTITGSDANRPTVSAKDRERALEAAVAANPRSAAAHLALARFRLGNNQGSGALEEFRTAAGLDPTNPEPFAYSGWVLRLQGYPSEGLELIDKALEVDESYPDARFFKGFILMRDLGRPAAAVPELQRYLVEEPDSPLASQVRALLAEAATATGTTTPRD